jgi:hypothetical protein
MMPLVTTTVRTTLDFAGAVDPDGGSGVARGGDACHRSKVEWLKPLPGKPTVFVTPRRLMLMLAPRGPSPRLTPELLKFSRTKRPKLTRFLNLHPIVASPEARS